MLRLAPTQRFKRATGVCFFRSRDCGVRSSSSVLSTSLARSIAPPARVASSILALTLQTGQEPFLSIISLFAQTAGCCLAATWYRQCVSRQRRRGAAAPAASKLRRSRRTRASCTSWRSRRTNRHPRRGQVAAPGRSLSLPSGCLQASGRAAAAAASKLCCDGHREHRRATRREVPVNCHCRGRAAAAPADSAAPGCLRPSGLAPCEVGSGGSEACGPAPR